MWRIVFCLTLAVVLWSSSDTAKATDATLRLRIQPQECTVDVLNTGVSQLTTVQPTECHQSREVVEQVQQASVIEGGDLGQALSLISSTEPEESQPSIDYGVLQPLAALLGVSQESGVAAMQPIPASVGLALAVGIVLDVAFFQRRWTRRTGRLMRYAGKKTIVLLRAAARL